MTLVVTDPHPEDSWRDRAACSGKALTVSPAMFFPDMVAEPYSPEWDAVVANAKTVCDTCTVQSECLDEAASIPLEELVGVWGGVEAAVLKRERRRRRKRSADNGEDWPVADSAPTVPREPTETSPLCGTSRGHDWHRNRNQMPCDPCREAHNAKRRAQYRQRPREASPQVRNAQGRFVSAANSQGQHKRYHVKTGEPSGACEWCRWEGLA